MANYISQQELNALAAGQQPDNPFRLFNKDATVPNVIANTPVAVQTPIGNFQGAKGYDDGTVAAKVQAVNAGAAASATENQANFLKNSATPTSGKPDPLIGQLEDSLKKLSISVGSGNSTTGSQRANSTTSSNSTNNSTSTTSKGVDTLAGLDLLALPSTRDRIAAVNDLNVLDHEGRDLRVEYQEAVRATIKQQQVAAADLADRPIARVAMMILSGGRDVMGDFYATQIKARNDEAVALREMVNMNRENNLNAQALLDSVRNDEVNTAAGTVGTNFQVGTNNSVYSTNTDSGNGKLEVEAAEDNLKFFANVIVDLKREGGLAGFDVTPENLKVRALQLAAFMKDSNSYKETFGAYSQEFKDFMSGNTVIDFRNDPTAVTRAYVNSINLPAGSLRQKRSKEAFDDVTSSYVATLKKDDKAVFQEQLGSADEKVKAQALTTLDAWVASENKKLAEVGFGDALASNRLATENPIASLEKIKDNPEYAQNIDPDVDNYITRQFPASAGQLEQWTSTMGETFRKQIDASAREGKSPQEIEAKARSMANTLAAIYKVNKDSVDTLTLNKSYLTTQDKAYTLRMTNSTGFRAGSVITLDVTSPNAWYAFLITPDVTIKQFNGAK